MPVSGEVADACCLMPELRMINLRICPLVLLLVRTLVLARTLKAVGCPLCRFSLRVRLYWTLI